MRPQGSTLVQLGRARKSIAGLLRTALGGLDDKLGEIIRERVTMPEGGTDEAKLLPWPDPVTDIGSVLDTVAGALQKILAAPNTHLDAETLWAAHTHPPLRRELGIRHSPRLGIQSKLEDSGKTTAMTALLYVAARATATSSLTGASLFRETDANHWTVLWDEADTPFQRTLTRNWSAFSTPGTIGSLPLSIVRCRSRKGGMKRAPSIRSPLSR